jgi:integrase/recombinase XerD
MADTGRKRPAEVLTEAELRALLAQCSHRAPTGIRDRALITVLYRAGLRVGEALALKVSDVDARQGTVRVLHGKGDRARTVGIDDGALAVVQLWLEARRQLGVPANGGTPLFCTLDGGELSANQVRQMLRRRAARAGIDKRVHPHGLRHTHAAELVREGVPVNVIQAQLGHSSLATTDVYLRHIAPADVIALGRSRAWAEDEPAGAS